MSREAILRLPERCRCALNRLVNFVAQRPYATASTGDIGSQATNAENDYFVARFFEPEGSGGGPGQFACSAM
jgi:hypothetical protein